MLVWTDKIQMVVYWKEVYGEMLEEVLLNLPAPETFLGRSVPTSYAFFCDDSFALQPNLVEPFSRKNLDMFTRICNYRFSSTRQVSENVFGIITNRLRVYRFPNFISLKKVRELTMAVLTLYNWLRSGQSKTVYMTPGFCVTYDSTTQWFIPGRWRKENSHDCLTTATWKQPICCCKENQGGV